MSKTDAYPLQNKTSHKGKLLITTELSSDYGDTSSDEEMEEEEEVAGHEKMEVDGEDVNRIRQRRYRLATGGATSSTDEYSDSDTEEVNVDLEAYMNETPITLLAVFRDVPGADSPLPPREPPITALSTTNKGNHLIVEYV